MTTQERIDGIAQDLLSMEGLDSFKASDYKTAGDALKAAKAEESEAWDAWRESGKASSAMEDVREVLEKWWDRAEDINETFGLKCSPGAMQATMEALTEYPEPLPPRLAEVVKGWKEPTTTAKNGRTYGERSINSIKDYSKAVAVFYRYRSICADAMVKRGGA